MECGTRPCLGASEKRNLYQPQNVSVVLVMPVVVGLLIVQSGRFCSFCRVLNMNRLDGAIVFLRNYYFCQKTGYKSL